jgi:hypothetical protein
MIFLLAQTSQNSPQYDFWRDGAWQSVGVVASVILGLLGLALTIFIFVRQTQKKSISYEVISSSPIISVLDEFRDNFEIKFKGKLVDSLTLLVIRFLNSGNVPIEERDYSRPLSIDFGDQVELLSVNVMEEIPRNLGVTLTHDTRYITVNPLLMNKGDSFTLQVLASKYSFSSVNGRISGVQRITKIDQRLDSQTSKKTNLKLAITASFVSLLAGILANSLSPGLIALVLPIISTLVADLVNQNKEESKRKKNQ